MLKITLDPGHKQGANVGVVNGYREGTTMYNMAYELKRFLEEYDGVQVFVTRLLQQDDPSLEARGKTAINNGSDVFISLHSDASGNKNVRGVTVIRSLKRPDSVALGKALANAVDGAMACGKSPYSGADGGVWTRVYPGLPGTDYYGVLRSAVKGSNVKYAYLIEHSFHTNPTDCTTLDSSAARQRVAMAEAETIAKFFNLHKKVNQTATITAPTHTGLYTVQTGAFSSKANAEKYAAELKAKGINAIVVQK